MWPRQRQLGVWEAVVKHVVTALGDGWTYTVSVQTVGSYHALRQICTALISLLSTANFVVKVFRTGCKVLWPKLASSSSLSETSRIYCVYCEISGFLSRDASLWTLAWTLIGCAPYTLHCHRSSSCLHRLFYHTPNVFIHLWSIPVRRDIASLSTALERQRTRVSSLELLTDNWDGGIASGLGWRLFFSSRSSAVT